MAKKLFKLLLLVIISTTSFGQNNFVHPGITHKLSDLDRIKYMVEAELDPWYSSYLEMVADSKSSYNYTVQGDPSFTELGRDSKVNYGAWNSDIRAAYYNALMWYITEDSRHAEKAIEIFSAWSNLTKVTSGGTDALSGGVGYIMIEAAEIIKSTYSGWNAQDIQDFQDMLVYPGYSTTYIPAGDNVTFYWMSFQGDPVRHGNQGLSGWRTVMAMGIFLDNEIMYDRALRYIKGLPHRSDDLPYPTGPRETVALLSSNDYNDSYSTSLVGNVADYGYNEVMTNYIWENGQCQESSRDQQHTVFGIGLLTSMAEMAWNQDDDLYGYMDDRLLLGLEYNMKYNVSFIQDYPDQPNPWNPVSSTGDFVRRFDRTKRWYSKEINPDGRGGFPGLRPVFEMPVAHYLGRGLKTEEEVKWIVRARDKSIEVSGDYEKAGWTNDAIGWGGLTARRPESCFGDPITGFDANNLPIYKMHIETDVIEAENFDYFVLSGNERAYKDNSTGNSGNTYRTNEDVDIESISSGNYNITNIEDGDWLTYTVYIPSSGSYDFDLIYSSTNSNGKIKLNLNNVDVTDAVVVPHGGTDSNGFTDWKTLSFKDLELTQGVQSLKLLFSGASNSFKIDKFSFRGTGNTSDQNPNLSVRQSSDYNTNTKAIKAIDGNTDPNFSAGFCSATKNEINPWWEAVYADEITVERIDIYLWNNYSASKSFTVDVINSNGTTTFSQSFTGEDKIHSIDAGGVLGKRVRITIDGENFLVLAEVEIFTPQSLSTEDVSNVDVKVFPNPTNDIINVSLTRANLGLANRVIRIYNILGVEVLSQKIMNDKQSINMSAFSKGIYFLKVGNNHNTIIRKIIKN